MAAPNPKKKRQKKSNSFAQSFLMLFFTVVSLSTDGFGIVQGSQLSQDFRALISESFPVEFILPINQYLEELALATVPVKTSTDVAETASPESENEDLAVLLAEEMVEAMLTAEGLATPQPTDTRQTPTAQPSPTPSAIPTSTSIPTQTSTPTSIPTSTFVWYPWTSTPKPPANQNPSCAGFNHSNPQTTGIVNIDIGTLCSDPDGDPWTITSVTQGANGSSTFGALSINYDPNDGFAGTDSLTFTISDGKGGTHTQSFDVIIVNLPPVTTTDSETVLENSITNTFNVLANDSDPGNDTFTITNKTNGSNGTTEVPPGNTMIRYRPAANYTGTDSFAYTVTDTHGGSTTETVSVSVTCAPVRMQVASVLCYLGPNTNYKWDSSTANPSTWRDISEKSSSFGPLFYKLTAHSCWVEATAILATQGSPANCVSDENAVYSVSATAGSICYAGPDSASYPPAYTISNNALFYPITGKNSDSGSLYYEMTYSSSSSAVPCWLEATNILASQGASPATVPDKTFP